MDGEALSEIQAQNVKCNWVQLVSIEVKITIYLLEFPRYLQTRMNDLYKNYQIYLRNASRKL